ncbi:calcium-binding protein [Microvirga aerilata]|uniref:Calcium-binding protein n=1 Tax=Microvirga aerilata TaxID=670292 RepID=A0A936ZAC0_9HYPH|nr:calcium-binding protein [Microvirga aerilata]MBL0402739.1 calcium-binding protein [Microvirga aerilata]
MVTRAFIGSYERRWHAEGDALRIDGTSELNQIDPKFAVLEDGRFVVTWVHKWFVGREQFTDIKARVLEARNGANDTLAGEAGHDRLYGGLGNDLLSGGAGKDVFVFDTKLNKRTNVDQIADFRYQDDSVYLENRIFTKLGAGTASKPKKFNSDMFTTGTKAQDAEDRIVYDKKSGALYYDQDGTGSKAQVKIATITNKAVLKHSDFFVI